MFKKIEEKKKQKRRNGKLYIYSLVYRSIEIQYQSSNRNRDENE